MPIITGLIFPGNGDVPDSNAESVRFHWANPHSIGLPIYGPSGAGVTYIWRYKPAQQTGYYTTFFWGNDDGAGTVADTFLWQGGPGGAADSYYGMHPYPPGGSSGTTHEWEISVEQQDFTNGAVAKDAWYSQAAVCWGAAGVAKQHEFYWDLPNVDAGHKVTRTTATTTWGDSNPPSPYLTFGDAPWQPGAECLSGILRGLQIYSIKLTEQEILDELASPLSTGAGAANVWYLNLNPTPDDLTDKSGLGHHPAWRNATKKATLFSAVIGEDQVQHSGDLMRRKFGRLL